MSQPATSTGFAAEAIRPGAGEIVGGGLSDAEHQDEREPGGVGPDAEDLLAEQGKYRPLLAEHPTHQSVDHNQKRELGGVLPKSQLDTPLGCWACHERASSAQIRPSGQSCGRLSSSVGEAVKITGAAVLDPDGDDVRHRAPTPLSPV